MTRYGYSPLRSGRGKPGSGGTWLWPHVVMARYGDGPLIAGMRESGSDGTWLGHI